MSTLSPEQLFLRYAYVCMDDRYARGLIEATDYERLKTHVEENTIPEQDLLLRSFSDATNGLIGYSKKEGKEPWTMEVVTAFWRYNHGHTGDCRVLQGEVVYVYSPIKVEVRMPDDGVTGEMNFFALNFYGIPLSAKNIVTLHRRVIIEHVA